MSIAARFALAMTCALAVVMFAAGHFLLGKTREVVDSSVDHSMVAATIATAEAAQAREESRSLYEQRGTVARSVGVVKRFDVRILEGTHENGVGHLYEYDAKNKLLSPDAGNNPREDLFGLFLVVTAAVVLVGAGVATAIATQISKPLDVLVTDVRAIARGNLQHRTRVTESSHLSTTGDTGAVLKVTARNGPNVGDQDI